MEEAFPPAGNVKPPAVIDEKKRAASWYVCPPIVTPPTENPKSTIPTSGISDIPREKPGWVSQLPTASASPPFLRFIPGPAKTYAALPPPPKSEPKRKVKSPRLRVLTLSA